MKMDNVVSLGSPAGITSAKTALEEVVLEGARKMLQAALEAEVSEFIFRFSNVVDTSGHRAAVRNGYLPKRDVVTRIGPVSVEQPRVRDKNRKEKFTSKILPPFLGRLPSIDALIPALYLKGVSTGDFSEALSAILGPQASGLSSTNIVRLKEGWEVDYDVWSTRTPTGKRYVYLWADGIYFNVRIEDVRPCVLVLMGATEEGKKEIVAVWDGQRESKESWMSVLRDLKRRGLEHPPELAIGDGALGFWSALEEEFPSTQNQRCWVHKTANVLEKLPKSVQVDAKKLIHKMYMAPKRDDAMLAYEEFKHVYHVKYPKAVECLTKDEHTLFTFYDFPTEHWLHLRTTNPIESTFATVRHRRRQTKGCGSRKATLAMVFKLALEAERTWRKLNGHTQLAKLIEGVKFVNGVVVDKNAA
jgi:putative transposase